MKAPTGAEPVTVRAFGDPGSGGHVLTGDHWLAVPLDAADRARALAAENQKRRASGLGIVYPQENYYGWLVNARLGELRKLL